jgi:hypothetical protein
MMMHFHDHATMPIPRHRASHVAFHVFMAVVLGGAFVLFFGYAVMFLWNAVMPALLGVGHLHFWKAVGLLLLARILVGGFHRGGFGGHRRFGRRSSFRQYEDWWREVGEQSFHDFSASRPAEEK